MKIATLVSVDAFEAEIVAESPLRERFSNSAEGVKKFEQWVLRAYRRGDKISLLIWDAETGLHATAFVTSAIQGQLRFRGRLPWRSVDGHLISVDHVGHSTAAEYARRFGYESLCIAAVVRRAKGEFPSLRAETT